MDRWFLPGIILFFLGCSGSGSSSAQPDQGFTVLDITLGNQDYHVSDPGNQPRDVNVPKDLGNRPDPGFTNDLGHDSGFWDLKQDQGQFDPGFQDPGQPDPGCVPNCAGRECGSDGCGGKCGWCKENENCIGGKCLCTPDCTDKECGDDGCGGSCGSCSNNLPCVKNASNAKCASYGPCKRQYVLECYDPSNQDDDHSVSGNNGGGWSFTDHSDVIDLYNCPSQIQADGPEVVYAFNPDHDGTVTVSFSTSKAFLDVYLLKGSCNGRECVDRSHSFLQFNVTAGSHWFIVVDAAQNRTGSYKMHASCSWMN